MTDRSPDPTDRDPHRTLEAEVEIHASPAQVWTVVSDVRRTGSGRPSVDAPSSAGRCARG